MVATLCHVIIDGKLLLQKKSKGLFGGEKWNGVGGKMNTNETPEECARREVFEETGLSIINLKSHGILNFYFGDRSRLDWIVHVFSTRTFKGGPRSSEEGVLQWFALEDIPYEEMWQDDRYWLPLLLDGKSFKGDFYFDEEGKQLLDFNLKTE